MIIIYFGLVPEGKGRRGGRGKGGRGFCIVRTVCMHIQYITGVLLGRTFCEQCYVRLCNVCNTKYNIL